jgi:hypothetical protein
MYGKGTIAGCLNGGIGFIGNASFEWCAGMDKDGLFLEYTAAQPGESWGIPGVGLGLGIQASDAPSSKDLNGPFKYGAGSIGNVSGSYAQGGGVAGGRVGAVGGRRGASASGGTSHTGVMQFGWCDNWIGVCMSPP